MLTMFCGPVGSSHLWKGAPRSFMHADAAAIAAAAAFDAVALATAAPSMAFFRFFLTGDPPTMCSRPDFFGASGGCTAAAAMAAGGVPSGVPGTSLLSLPDSLSSLLGGGLGPLHSGHPNCAVYPPPPQLGHTSSSSLPPKSMSMRPLSSESVPAPSLCCAFCTASMSLSSLALGSAAAAVECRRFSFRHWRARSSMSSSA